MLLEVLRREIDADIHNLKEARKLPESKRALSYINSLNSSIPLLVRRIGRIESFQITGGGKYMRSNNHAYGRYWLKTQGVVL